jgi:nucleoside-diphosphate-sugar epimerase
LSDSILITGGSGFVGRFLIPALVAGGRPVLALARSESAAERVRALGAKPIVADLLDPATLDALPDGIDAVVHLAATPILRPGNPPRKSAFADVRRSRVEGTSNLVRALEKRGGTRLLLSASASAYPAGPEKRREEDPLWTANPYGALIAEWEGAARTDDFPTVCLRFPPMYGPTAEGGLGAVFLPPLLEGKGPKVIGNPTVPGSYLHVEDTVAAILAVLETADGSDVLNLSDDRPVTPMGFAQAAAEAFDARKPGSVPAFLVRLVVGKDLLGLIQTPPATDNARLKERYGWSPRFPDAASGWRAVAEALRRDG